MARTVSATGRAALTQREGLRLTAYLDSVGVPTIGVGHAATAPTPPAVRMGMTITREEADEILSRDLAVFDAAVNAADPKGRLSQNAHDAAVSLAFNIGRSAFGRSTVARKIAEGDMPAAGDAFLMWNKPAVLLARRRAERTQFLTPDAPIAVSASVPTAAPAHIDVARVEPRPAGLGARLRFLVTGRG